MNLEGYAVGANCRLPVGRGKISGNDGNCEIRDAIKSWRLVIPHSEWVHLDTSLRTGQAGSRARGLGFEIDYSSHSLGFSKGRAGSLLPQ